MKLPSFFDKTYMSAEHIHLSDRLLANTLLRWAPRWLTPNILTVVRIIMTPFVVVLLVQQQYEWGVALFLLAALTDALDGAMARTRNMITVWGRMFDPFADKLLVISVAIVLAYHNLPTWLVGTVIVSELTFIIAALFWHRQGRLVQANVWGKIKMCLQVASLTALLLTAWLGLPLAGFAAALLATSLLFAGASFLRYGG